MARRACIIKCTGDLHFPFGLPQIIADYGDWGDNERLEELFRINGGKYIKTACDFNRKYVELTRISRDVIKISYAVWDHGQNFCTDEFVIRFITNKSYIWFLHAKCKLNIPTLIFLTESLYGAWCAL